MPYSPVFDALAMLPVGLHVLTVQTPEGPLGLLCGWVTPTSWEPPMLAAAVGRSHHTHGAVVDGGAFALNLLRPEQLELAQRFGTRSGRDTDKFDQVDWRSGVTGSPVLLECAGYLECRVVNQVESGDHTLFLGDIVAGAVFADRCLVYRRQEHQRLFVERNCFPVRRQEGPAAS